MATPRPYLDYPLEYTELFRRAFKNPIRIDFPTILQAKRFRNHLYAFRTAIRDSIEGDGVPDELLLIAPLLAFPIEGNAVVVNRPKRVDTMAKALEAAER